MRGPANTFLRGFREDLAQTRRMYERHACKGMGGPVVRVRAAITDRLVAGICLACGEQVSAHEAATRGEED